MPLPKSAAAADKEYFVRTQNLGAHLSPDAPKWAIAAFRKAIMSSPMMAEVLTKGESKPFLEGFFVALLPDIRPLYAAFEKYTIKRLSESPTDRRIADILINVRDRIRLLNESLERVSLGCLSDDPARRELFFAGLAAYKSGKMKPMGPDFGNLATLPHAYIAVFWQEFSEFKTIKEAYDGLLGMFDRKEASAGSFESFRKRARAIGLKYPITAPSR